MGLFLSLEGSFGAEQLLVHKWFGVALSFVCWGLVALKRNEKLLKPAGVAGVVILVFTGHYCANLTHGEDFVWAPLQGEEEPVARVITDSTSLFTAAIEPVFEAKCYGCHNPKKAKGNLVLTSIESILKGGESGPLWHPENAANSLLVKRLLLPLDHDDHMPPKDKAQLTDDEIDFISLWIDGGADMKQKIGELSSDDTLSLLASAIIPRYQQQEPDRPKYTFEFAPPEKIKQLSRPNRSVFQIAGNEPAIQADFFLRDNYHSEHLKELLEVKDQLVSLNLSKMPVQDADLAIISKFRNLETLNLNHTAVTGEGLVQLRAMPMLKTLSLSGTSVDAAALRQLGGNTSLKEVYVWNTRVSPTDVQSLEKDFPKVRWDVGFVADETEILKLNAPLLKNKGQILAKDEKVVLKHNLPGTEIRYSLDGSDPDSTDSPVFKDELSVGTYTVIKARAFKDGWHSSDVAEFFFFRKGFQPDTAQLETEPDKGFPGEGTMTLFDGKQGLPDFYKHPAWMAFRENDLVLSFAFEKEVPTVTNVTLSFAHNNGSICMPPEEMQLWGGDNPDELKLVSKHNPAEIPRPGKARIEGFTMEVPPSKFKHYRLVAKPTRKLADGNPKNRRLWLMVDEVFIN